MVWRLQFFSPTFILSFYAYFHILHCKFHIVCYWVEVILVASSSQTQQSSNIICIWHFLRDFVTILVIMVQSNCNELDCVVIIYSLFPNTYGVLCSVFWYQEISVCNCVITWKMCSWPEESDAAFCSKGFFGVMNVEVIHFFVLNNQWNITRNRYTYWYVYWPILKRISHSRICSFLLWILNGIQCLWIWIITE